jgi:hypothetical protein
LNSAISQYRPFSRNGRFPQVIVSHLTRSLGGSISIAICQNIFEQKLRKNLADILPGVDSSIIGGSGATTLLANPQAAFGEDNAAV